MLTSFLRFTARLGLFSLLFLVTPVYSMNEILLVMSNDGKIYQDFSSLLEKKLNVTTTKISYLDVNSEILNNYRYIISVGTQAASVVSSYQTKSTVIHSLIPDEKISGENIKCKNSDCYKVYIDQPIERYIKLYKVIFPKDRQLVIVASNKDSDVIRDFNVAAEKNNITYKIISVADSENIPRTFIQSLRNNDVLLALPDPSIYNAANAKSIILSTYHSNVPIVAYSKSFARAGALISLYSSIENVTDKTVMVINDLRKNKQLKQKEFYPDSFMVEVNSNVARSMNIDIEPENALMRYIK